MTEQGAGHPTRHIELLGHPGYDGYFVAAHRHVHELEPFEVELFDRWYVLFVETVDAEWAGPMADTAERH